ncbi:MAG TPA: glycosyltransferase [Pseudolabrys sp.]|nr:glycosyltransferase [Pseudolabrys sp.]
MESVLAILSGAVWIYLLSARGGFWLGRVKDSIVASRPNKWPAVVAVIPARNESEVIAASVQSLLRQDYPGAFQVVVVDDDSNDETSAIAVRTAAAIPGRSLTVIRTNGPSPGWTGKLWALNQGIATAEKSQPEYLLLTDADIVHAPDTLAWLVAQSLSGRFVLTSLMAKLRCESFAERSHVPAFIYFFQMLFPFSWVCRSHSKTAAAAGGCMLICRDALASVGGLASIHNALIDDCSLAAKLKKTGSIWLGLTDRVHSIRPYDTLSDVQKMISRSAYAQLRNSPWLLLGTIAGMAITFIIPPLLAIFVVGLPRYLGLATWAAMALSFMPTLRFYRLSLLWSMALPGIALLYLYYTVNSAYKYLRRRGGQWKGRVHVDAPSLR